MRLPAPAAASWPLASSAQLRFDVPATVRPRAPAVQLIALRDPVVEELGRLGFGRIRSVSDATPAWRSKGSEVFRSIGMDAAGAALDGEEVSAAHTTWPQFVPVTRLIKTRSGPAPTVA